MARNRRMVAWKNQICQVRSSDACARTGFLVLRFRGTRVVSYWSFGLLDREARREEAYKEEVDREEVVAVVP